MTTVPLKVHYFQHSFDDGYGSLVSYWQQMEANISHTAFHELPVGQVMETMPAIDDVDILIVMGGSMSVNDEVIYPWLKQEKEWIRKFIDQDKPVLGLCLGGQLIACSFGAVVKKNNVQELGWWPIYKVEHSAVDYPVFEFPIQITALSWHEDTFELPEGAVLLAGNEACPRQAYQYKHNVLGFQFHPEATPHQLALYLYDKDEINEYTGPYVQQKSKLKEINEQDFKTANDLLERAAAFVLRASGYL